MLTALSSMDFSSNAYLNASNLLNVLEDLSSDLLYLSSNGDRELTQYIMNNLENISAIKDFTNLE